MDREKLLLIVNEYLKFGNLEHMTISGEGVLPIDLIMEDFGVTYFDHDQLYLILKPAIGERIEIKIKPGWIY